MDLTNFKNAQFFINLWIKTFGNYMDKHLKKVKLLTKLELEKARFEVFENESGREGVDLIAKSSKGSSHEIHVQSINLDKDRSVKIPKPDLGEPKDNLWVALVLFMDEEVLRSYLIPSKQLADADDYIFIDNNVAEPFSHLSNWEIKVFTNGIPELSKFALSNMVAQLQ